VARDTSINGPLTRLSTMGGSRREPLLKQRVAKRQRRASSVRQRSAVLCVAAKGERFCAMSPMSLAREVKSICFFFLSVSGLRISLIRAQVTLVTYNSLGLSLSRVLN